VSCTRGAAPNHTHLYANAACLRAVLRATESHAPVQTCVSVLASGAAGGGGSLGDADELAARLRARRGAPRPCCEFWRLGPALQLAPGLSAPAAAPCAARGSGLGRCTRCSSARAGPRRLRAARAAALGCKRRACAQAACWGRLCTAHARGCYTRNALARRPRRAAARAPPHRRCARDMRHARPALPSGKSSTRRCCRNRRAATQPAASSAASAAAPAAQPATSASASAPTTSAAAAAARSSQPACA
jgi:hypothetical protein